MQALEIVLSDITEPVTSMTLPGAVYWLMFTDDYTRFKIVYLIKRKSEALKSFQGIQNTGGVTASRGVTESTIIATIHCSDVGYCLFRNPLVTHIPYHVPSLLL